MNYTKAFRHLSIVSAIAITGAYFLTKEEAPVVKLSPLLDLSVKKDIFAFNSKEAFALHTRDGSTVYIDANSFERKDGKAIIGDVEVSFREYHNVMDVIRSRVIMTYDSAGVKYHLQSAGMFDIEGNNAGSAIQLKEGKEIRIDLLTKTNGGKFNFYKFENNAWRFLHKDESFSEKGGRGLEEIEQEIIEVSEKIKKIVSVMPIKPSVVDDNKLNIKIDFKAKEFPELAVFKDVLFEFVDAEMSVENFEKYDWDFVEINKKENGIYQLSVYSDGDKYVFNTKPVIANDQESGVFATLFNKYETELSFKRGIAKALNVEKMIKFRAAEMERKSSLRAYQSLNLQASETEKTRARLIRSFQISSFGMYNSDCPANLPEGPIFAANFKASDSDSLKHHYAYLVEKNTKRLFTFYPANYSNFRCDPKSNNMIVILTDSNRLYACDSNAFKGVGNRPSHEFELSFKEIDSELSIKSELNF
jgi:hypothetical protein